MDELLEHLEIAKGLHHDLSRHLSRSVMLGWEKLDKYYSLTDTNPVLYAAVALHPSLKFEYFKYAWKEHPNWIANAKKEVQNLWESQYKSRTPTPPSSGNITLSTNSIMSVSSALSSWRQKHIPSVLLQDELEEFTSTNTIMSIENPREWWAQHQKNYPRLSQMALDILAIPAMSSEVERVFSSAGMLLPSIFIYAKSYRSIINKSPESSEGGYN